MRSKGEIDLKKFLKKYFVWIVFVVAIMIIPATNSKYILQKSASLELKPDQYNLIVNRSVTAISSANSDIEFNIQKMYCVVLNFVGEILYSSSVLVSYNPNTNGILKKMEEMITECLDFLGSNRVKVIGIGLGLPGYIDTANGIALNYVYIKDWKDIGIREYFETLFKIPCFIANNVDCMALAYKWLSRKGNAKDSIFISIRTGARLVPIINGFPYFGFNGSAGELGHIPLKGNNRSCSCGKKGCLNTIISDFSVINELKEKIENEALPFWDDTVDSKFSKDIRFENVDFAYDKIEACQKSLSLIIFCG